MAITYKWDIPQMNAHIQAEGEDNVISRYITDTLVLKNLEAKLIHQLILEHKVILT